MNALMREFNGFLEEQVRNRSIYVWGGQGEMHPTITKAWIRGRENSTANANRAIAFWEKQVAAGYQQTLRAFDCSGLGMYFFQNLKKVYKTDMSANGMMRQCDTITRSSLRNGDWVFRVNGGRATHIGYIVDDNLTVIEAKGRDEGVVKRVLNASGTSYWNAYGRPRIYKKAITIPSNPTPAPPSNQWAVNRLLKLTSPMMRGEDVKTLQKRLYEEGYRMILVGKTTKELKPDGIFGEITRNAVRMYQKANKLTVDGIAGRHTITSLGGVWTA